MKESTNGMTRRSFVAGAVILPALAGAVLAETTTAQAKGSQASVKYQSTPKNGQKCSDCKFYVPGKSSTANGTCQIVDGSISPNGWCIAFQKK
jgi:hypothetical protein